LVRSPSLPPSQRKLNHRRQAGMGPLQAAAHDLREQCDGTLRSTDTEPGIGTHLKGAYVLLSEMGVILGVPPGNQ